MTKPVSSVTSSTQAASSTPIQALPAPKGISAMPTTSSSLNTNKKEGLVNILIEFVRNILKSIIIAIRDIFLSIIPINKLLSKKPMPSDKEIKYFDLRKKLYRIDSISSLLAMQEAEDLLPDFNAFIRLAEIEFVKKEFFIISLVVQRKGPSAEDKMKLGKEIAQRDYKKLIVVLEAYYKAQVRKLENELKEEKRSN